MALIPLNTFKTKTAVLTTAEYNNETCARDTGLIVDSIAFDLLYGFGLSQGNSTQSTFAGLQYWAQDAIKIPGDVMQTLAALDRAKEISKQIVLNEPVVFSANYDGPDQITDQNNPGQPDDLLKISSEYDLISKIIENGTKGVTDLIIPNEHDVTALANEWIAETEYKYGTILKTQNGEIINYYKVIKEGTSGALPPTGVGTIVNGSVTLEYISINESIYNSAELLLKNKELIQKEITTYVGNVFNEILYDKPKFIKNAKLFVDSLAFDLLSQGSSQSKFFGLQYWARTNSFKIPNQISQTIASITRMRDIVLQIIKNELVTKSSNNLLDQSTDYINPGNSASITAITNLFNLIIDILTNGVPSAIDIIVPNSQMTTYSGLLNAYKLIQANKLFIQAEIIAWIDDQINNSIAPFDEDYEFVELPKREKCYRDTGYIIDCVSFDLVHTSSIQANRQSVQAAVYYYTRSDEIITVTPTEQSQTVTVFNYLKSLMDEIVTGKSIAVTYQSDIKQLINLPPATNIQADYLKTQVDFITNIIENGPSVVTDVEPINLISSSNSSDINGFRLLLANKDFLVAEAIAFIDNSTNGDFILTGDRLAICQRDLGYIVDCIVFDLRHGGNRQAIQAGVYYYDHSAKVSVIPRERIDTTEAYNYMKTIIEGVLNNTMLTTNYQTDVKQLTNLAVLTSGTVKNNIIAASTALVSKINQIISSGVTSISNIDDNKMPIKLDIISTDTNELIKAFNLLLANREFIIAEVIGYLNTKLATRPNTTKIYTAPPGITAIILMAQAANVTEHDVNVTFAHYRNIPVFADPATYNGYQAANTTTELVKDFTIPSKNAASLIDGKMIVESFDSIIAYADVSDSIKVTLSILETANA